MGKDYIEDFFDRASHAIGEAVGSALDYIWSKRPKNKQSNQEAAKTRVLRKQLKEARKAAEIRSANERLQCQIDALKPHDKSKGTGVRTV